MLSFLLLTTLLTYTNSCSLAQPPEGQYYVQKVELLSEIDYPNQVLLTIDRTTDVQPITSTSRLSFENTGPWCKLMNIMDGSVTDIVTCNTYTTRSYATADIDSTTVSCQDNCDGATATCTIDREDNSTHIIDNIPYTDSESPCTTSTTIGIGGSGIAISFTINDISTTYISFKSNMIAIQFNHASAVPPYDIYTVERVGTESDWMNLIPGYGFGITNGPSMYSSVDVISIGLPCCICYSHALYQYDIETDVIAKTQIFTLNSVGFSGGQIDAIKPRAISWGISFSKRVTIYDLSKPMGGITALTPNVFEPDLCDVMVNCLAEPCADTDLNCPYNINARCVNDYCGGCNARWFCGTMDVTNYCDSDEISTQQCITQTSEPETNGECIISDIPFEVNIDSVCEFCFADAQDTRDCRKIVRKETNTDKIDFDNGEYGWIVNEIRNEAQCMLEYCKDINSDLPSDCTLDRVVVKRGKLLKDDCTCNVIECQEIDPSVNSNDMVRLRIFVGFGFIVSIFLWM